jgi:hypothetical protein
MVSQRSLDHILGIRLSPIRTIARWLLKNKTAVNTGPARFAASVDRKVETAAPGGGAGGAHEVRDEQGGPGCVDVPGRLREWMSGKGRND